MAHSTAVHIFIDRKKLTSATPTAGRDLYLLGGVGSGYDLFREAHGSGDDELIKNDDTQYQLHDGEKFYTAQSTLNPGGDGECCLKLIVNI